MVKKGRPKKQACKSTAKVIGKHVTVKTTCPLKIKAPCLKSGKKTVSKKRKEVPTPCKNLRGNLRKICVKSMKKYY